MENPEFRDVLDEWHEMNKTITTTQPADNLYFFKIPDLVYKYKIWNNSQAIPKLILIIKIWKIKTFLIVEDFTGSYYHQPGLVLSIRTLYAKQIRISGTSTGSN